MNLRQIAISFIIICLSTWALAHGGKKHSYKKENPTISPIVLEQINRSLKGPALSALTKACFDCHSHQTVYPWYYEIPGIKGFIDHDIKEARDHLTMGKTFPFQGSGDPEADLEEILEEIEEEKMPLPLYSLFHPSSRLKETEKAALIKWIKESIKLLKNLSN